MFLTHPWCQRLIALAVLVTFLPALGEAVESLRSLPIDEEDAPEIDGDLSDPIWERVPLIENLTQMYPVGQSAPSEKTEIRICHDPRNLYVSFRCFDRNPEEVNASIMQRDQSVGPDDYVFILLDPYQTGREGFYFRLNANGAMGDGKVSGSSNNPNMDWDAIWDGGGNMTEEGWSVEFSIPFRSLSFDPSRDNWNANFGRWLPRLQERNRWSGADRQRRFLKLEDAGVISGLSDLQRGRGIDLKPYFLTHYQSNLIREGTYQEYGADVFWQVTPNLTTTLTWNTDFAETEVDDRVVNLTRFPIFFPEKRDFFLEGQEYFEFGPVSSSLRPFHSRTIGLSSDLEQVDIDSGAKVTGRVGKVGIGMLATQLGETADLLEDEVGVLRLTHDIGAESRVGTFFSYGNPRANVQNFVAGVDFDFKNSHFSDGTDQVELKVFELMSRDENYEIAHAFGAELRYPNEPISYRLSARQVDELFDPALGFVKRPGTRRIVAAVEKEYYPDSIEWLREISVETSGFAYTNLDNDIETAEVSPVEVQLELESGDEFYISPEWNREVLFEPFGITDAVTIPEGIYDFTRLVAGFETSNHRPVSVELFGRTGTFYDGSRHGFGSELEWRASKHFGFETEIDFSTIDLPGGEFEVLVGSTGFRYTPNPRVSWNTIAQWDSVSNQVGLNSRVRYIINSGSDIFLVFNQGFLYTDRQSFRQDSTAVTAKLGWTFRW